MEQLAVSELQQITVEKVFVRVKRDCDPLRNFGSIFDMFFGGRFTDSPFVGGNGDYRGTTHENMFHLLYPFLKRQVSFGTGKGGYEKWLAKRYIADFYDEDSKTIYEIDGPSHRRKYRALADELRTRFFQLELGIRVVRFTNRQVEEMMFSRLKELEAEGRVKDVVGH